ncbi:MFS transporter [Parabacteroides sp. AM58-2XD]|uniref:MFS transporter n=1 Tax=Parabacteroides TaxID=375288 RepID=UPI000FE25240|nr:MULTISPECIES: MFS transporter [Parabacteroides]RGY96799.1 MFS transporter [Parabacteroides sp. AM58-2XD]GKG73137.1 MFS transporter [Parabacteroides goldsteinii]GKG79072.1 MFS transporter [Parabacteroides goldsteinii]
MDSNNHVAYSKEHIRFAVLSFFLAQGLCFSSWASRIPDIKEIFTVNDALYWGIVLFMIPVGKFVAIPLAGYLVSKLGSRIMVQISIMGYALSLFAIGTALNIYMLGVFLFCFGVFWNLCDISLNTQGIGIERLYGRTIMASFHGGWSLAACLGALIGFIMIVSDITPFWHFTLIAALILLLTMVSRRYLQDDVSTADVKEEAVEDKSEKWQYIKKPEMLLIKLGLVGLFALVVESAMFDWSGVYFESVLQVPKSLQIGFLVFMVMMTVGRFLANYAYRIWGKQRVLQLSGAFIFIGFFTSALLGSTVDSMALKVIVNSFGFMLVGLGISSMVPTIYSLVGAKSKTPVGIALTILSSISFIGSLVAPLLIGAISQAFNMEYAYMVVGLLGLCILLMTTFSKAFR